MFITQLLIKYDYTVSQTYVKNKCTKKLIQMLMVYRIQVIIVVIITLTGEKTSQKKKPHITVIRVSDFFKWVMFMQNFVLDVTVFNHLEAFTRVLLFSVCCFQ